jgi:hypothetical protein
MKKKAAGQSQIQKVALVALAGALLSLLSACVYLRLLEVKKQLQNFDENFALSGRSELVIEFKNPILRTKDARFLIGADPLSQSGSEEVIQHFEFDLVRSSSVPVVPPLGRLGLDLALRRGRLVKIIVPESFMLLFPRNVVVETLKQAKDAEVFEMKKLARGKIHLDREVEAQLPSYAKTLFLMGEPLQRASDGDLQILTYRYTISKAAKDVLILTQLSFDANGLLRKAFVHWDESAIEAVFVREETHSR